MILIIYVFAIFFAFYVLKKIKLRREIEHEKRQERFERLMSILKKQNSDMIDEVSNTTKDNKNF